MKLCLTCSARFKSSEWYCRLCGDVPTIIDGFPAFAPELAQASEGFRSEYFSQLAGVEERNFWFRARNRLILWALGRYYPRARTMLEIGCGTGQVLAGIRQAVPSLTLFGSEVLSVGLAFSAARVPTATFFQMDARHIPFDEEFDVIGAFDVIEHIQEDEEVLRQAHRALCPKGGLLLTVPQHQFLWSRQDETACHYRRYEAGELAAKVTRAGFVIERMTSFVSTLLPLMFVSRYRKRRADIAFDAMGELRMGRLTNLLLERVLDVERAVISAGINMPLGGSLLMIARKV